VHERYRRQTTDRRQTDERTTTYSEHEHELTFAKNVQLTFNEEVHYALSNEPKIGLYIMRCPKAPKGAQERKIAVFRVKLLFT